MHHVHITDEVRRVCHRSGEATLITDPQGTIEYVNPAFERLTGFSSDHALGRTPSILKSGVQDADFYRQLWDTLRAGREFRGVLVNRRSDGRLYHEEKHIRPLFDARGDISHFLASGHDVSEREAVLARLVHEATHDRLTGLPNRALAEERLREATHESHATGSPLTLLVVDLDRFKEINDEFGHGVGDDVLCDAARRLREVVRQGDTLARWGGDEFVLLLPVAEEAQRVRDAIARAFEAPVRLADGTRLGVGVSIGSARFPDDAATPQALLQAADRAMYRDKALRRRPSAPACDDQPSTERTDPFALLAEQVPVRRCPVHPAEVLYRAGDRFRDVIVLHAGLVKLTSLSAEGREELVSLLHTGDWMGFDGLADGRHACTASAADTGEVWRVRYEALLQAGCRHPPLLALLHREMARQGARERDDLLAQHALPANGRVADFLYRWVEGLQARGQRIDQIVLPVTRAELGTHLGLRIESVSRAMARLERERLIEFCATNRRELIIPRPKALREFARRTAEPAASQGGINPSRIA